MYECLAVTHILCATLLSRLFVFLPFTKEEYSLRFHVTEFLFSEIQILVFFKKLLFFYEI